MNVVGLRRTQAVQKILEDIQRYLKARVRPPAEIVVSRDTFAKLKDQARTDALDYNGIRLVCR